MNNIICMATIVTVLYLPMSGRPAEIKQRPKLFRGETTKIMKPDQATIEKVKSAKAKLKISSKAKPDKRGPATLDEALEFITTNVNMACPPGVCVEYDGVFYFSGGRSTQLETNFLSGFAIKKGDTAIHMWEAEVKKKDKQE